MKPKPLVITLSVILTTIAVIIGANQAKRSASARTALVELRAKYAAAENDLRIVESRIESRIKQSLPKESAPSETQSKPLTDTQVILAQISLLEKNPKLQALYLKSNRARTHATYSPFYRQLQLTAAQISAFEEITAQRDERLQYLAPAAKSLGITLDDSAIRKLSTEASLEYHGRMKNLLGESAYPRLIDYDRTSWLRSVVSQIAGAATLAEAPFTPVQTEQLISIIANASPRYMEGGWAETTTVDWEIVDAQARTILSPEQFEAFTTLESSNSGRFLTKLHGAIAAAKKADAERAASGEKN